jgi:hypothetical protein
MTTTAAVNEGMRWGWHAHDAAGWLGLAAAPTFALIGWIAASDPSQAAFCHAGTGVLSMDGMPAMYLLMSLFHLPPWLRLAAGRRPARL